MSTVILINSNNISEFNKLKFSLKEGMQQFIDVKNIKDIKIIERERVYKLVLLWDNIRNKNFVTFFDEIKLKPLKNKKNKQNKSAKYRNGKNYYGTRKKSEFKNYYTRKITDYKQTKLQIIDAAKDWTKTSNNKQRILINNKNKDLINKRRNFIIKI